MSHSLWLITSNTAYHKKRNTIDIDTRFSEHEFLGTYFSWFHIGPNREIYSKYPHGSDLFSIVFACIFQGKSCESARLCMVGHWMDSSKSSLIVSITWLKPWCHLDKSNFPAIKCKWFNINRINQTNKNMHKKYIWCIYSTKKKNQKYSRKMQRYEFEMILIKKNHNF